MIKLSKTAGETATTVTNLDNLVNDVKIAEELVSETICEGTSLDVWRDVEGYEGRYEVSFLGHLRFVDRTDKRLVRCSKYGNYLRANLKHKGDDGAKNIAVHILVATAFVPNPEGYAFVRHKNGRLQDNRADNLEWVEKRPEKKKKKKSKRTSRTVSALPILEVSDDDWKDVMGFEGRYKISKNGRVVSLNRKKLRCIKATARSIKNRGHLLSYNLRDKDGGKHHKMVHMLVAEHFIPNPLGYKYVMHIDGNPKNNNADNLRWTERFVQCREKKSEDYKTLEGKHNLMTTQEVEQYYTDGTYINTFKSIAEAAEKTKLSYGSIKKVLSGKKTSIGGYVWKYSGNVYQTQVNRTIVEEHISKVSLPNWIHKVDRFFTFCNEAINKVKNIVKSFFGNSQYTRVLTSKGIN